MAANTSDTPRPWRELIPLHPAADLFPALSPDELKALADDIKKIGLLTAIVLSADGTQLIDGRSRLDAMELVGLPIFKTDGALAVQHCRLGPKDAPEEHVVSLNIRRRHLTTEQKRELIAKLVKANPERTDRHIAALANVSPTTVGTIRKANVQIGHKPDRVEANGRKARGRKPVRRDANPSPAAPETPRPRPIQPAPLGKIRSFDLGHDDVEAMARIIVDALGLARAKKFAAAVAEYLSLQAAREKFTASTTKTLPH